MAGFEPRTLGRTGVLVGPLGLAASYGADDKAVEAAFERGVRYFYWGSFRRPSFGKGLRNVCKKARDKVVVVIQSYTRVGMLLGVSVRRALRKLDTDTCDVVLLGWWNSAPPTRIVDAAKCLRDKGVVKHIALSTHHRPLVADLAPGADWGALHIRYNATHRGAEKEVFAKLPEARDSRAGIVAFTATRWGHLLERPKGLADDVPVPTAGDCYRFCLTDPHVDCVLAGAQNEKQVNEALDQLAKGPMSPDELAWMRKVGDQVRASVTTLRDR
jgi:aryl-alcohol dehydrogenase-like predicted oxidoreductase